jgi:prevent-host-death family protein
VDTTLGQCVHMDVGVRELKQHLSEYLERAANGETIRVTDRGQAKALLCPLPGVSKLNSGITEGWIRAADPGLPLPVSRAKAKRAIADVLDEDRGV